MLCPQSCLLSQVSPCRRFLVVCVAQFQRFFLLLCLTEPGGSLYVCGGRSLFGWAWHALRASSATFRHSSVWRTVSTTARCVSRRTPQSRASSTYCLSRWSGSTYFYWVLFPLYFVFLSIFYSLASHLFNPHSHGDLLTRRRRGSCRPDSCSFDTSREETLADLVSGECRTVPA